MPVTADAGCYIICQYLLPVSGAHGPWSKLYSFCSNKYYFVYSEHCTHSKMGDITLCHCMCKLYQYTFVCICFVFIYLFIFNIWLIWLQSGMKCWVYSWSTQKQIKAFPIDHIFWPGNKNTDIILDLNNHMMHECLNVVNPVNSVLYIR